MGGQGENFATRRFTSRGMKVEPNMGILGTGVPPGYSAPKTAGLGQMIGDLWQYFFGDKDKTSWRMKDSYNAQIEREDAEARQRSTHRF